MLDATQFVLVSCGCHLQVFLKEYSNCRTVLFEMGVLFVDFFFIDISSFSY